MTYETYFYENAWINCRENEKSIFNNSILTLVGRWSAVRLFNEVRFCSGYPRGRLELIVGPMCSDKTSELLRRIRRFGTQKWRRCSSNLQRSGPNLTPPLFFPYLHNTTLSPFLTQDQRYSTRCVSAHDKIMIETVSVSKLSAISECWSNLIIQPFCVSNIDCTPLCFPQMIITKRLMSLELTKDNLWWRVSKKSNYYRFVHEMIPFNNFCHWNILRNFTL